LKQGGAVGEWEQMLASQRRTEQQNAIYKDMTAFMAVYPEVKQSLKIVLEQLVRERPADPLGFMALRLRFCPCHAKESDPPSLFSVRCLL
jgi:hypothetical protein